MPEWPRGDACPGAHAHERGCSEACHCEIKASGEGRGAARVEGAKAVSRGRRKRKQKVRDLFL